MAAWWRGHGAGAGAEAPWSASSPILPSTAIRSEFRSGRPRATPEGDGVAASVRARFPGGGDVDMATQELGSSRGELG